MPASKIQDMGEALRWITEGRTYAWMVEQYRTKYHIETTISMWSNLRHRRGIEVRQISDTALIPWKVREEHRVSWPGSMIRAEARRRAGKSLKPSLAHAVDAWIAGMAARGMVLHYDPDLPKGRTYTPRRSGVDLDLIREPAPGAAGLR